MVFSKIRFSRAIAISQTGATRVGKNRYQLGGGIFTGRQLARGRAQFAMLKFNVPKPRAYTAVGLRL